MAESEKRIEEPKKVNENGTIIKDIFTNSGSKFQIFVQIASVYLAITVTWEFMISIFSGNGAGWKCASSSNHPFCLKNSNMTFTNENKDFEFRCQLNRSDWTYNVHKTYSFVTEFDLICTRTPIAAVVSSAYYIGGFFGSFIAGIASDYFGRKPVLIITILGMVASSIGGSFVANAWSLFVFNVLVGAFSVSCFVTVYVYQLEYVTPSFRAVSGALMQMSITLSGCFLDLISYYVRYWRKLKIYTALPCAVTLIAILLAPESPRWLLSAGKMAKAKKAMKRICMYNNKPFQGVELNQENKDETDKKYNYSHLFNRREVLTLTFCIGLVWFTVALVAFALLMESANIGGSVYQAFVLSALGNLPAYVLAPYTSNRFGRKKATLSFLSASGVLVGCMAFVPTQSEYRYYIDLSILIASNCLIGTTFTLLYIWTFEIYPTQIRSQGMSICIIFERIGAIMAPFMTRVLQQTSHILPFIIMFVLAVLATFAGLKLPETNKRPLREKYRELFETPQHTQSITGAYDNQLSTTSDEKRIDKFENNISV